MSILSDATSLIVGSIVASTYAGLGATGAAITSAGATGEHGAGVGLNDGLLAGSEYLFEVASQPASGTVAINELGQSTLTVAADGVYTWTYRLREDGVYQGGGPTTVTNNIGAASLALTAANCTQANTCSTGVVTITAAGLALTAANCTQANTCSTGVVTITAAGLALTAANCTQANTCTGGVVTLTTLAGAGPVGTRFEDWLGRVLPYVPGCPQQTALLHINDAAKMFCRRTLAWNYPHATITTVAGQADYSLSLAAGVRLTKVLACEVRGGATYTPARGGIGRQAVRYVSGNVCLLAGPTLLSLSPAPPVGGQPLLVDIAVTPDDSGTAVWPDELQEHIEFIAYGAIGTLCIMPGVTWRDIGTAGINAALFEQRINAVYHTTARTMVRPEAARNSVQF